MCTLLLGIDIFAPGSTLLGANRDEDPARPTDGPGWLDRERGIAGGRDRRAGGTWLAVRGDRIAVALLNRRGRAPATALNSRGQLTLEVARTPDPGTVLRALEAATYAPFTLVCARPGSAWLVAWDGIAARTLEPTAGWHALTHAELDGPEEPRTAHLLRGIESFRPRDRGEAEAGLIERLSRHESPAVCLHDGAMPTVSASLVWLAREELGYRHAEGRPCVTPFQDHSSLWSTSRPQPEVKP